jgi:23S rRNA pseudouridine1911/1915/1917 synthase
MAAANPPSPAARTEEFQVSSDSNGVRLDQFLVANKPDLTRSRLKGLIDSGEVEVNGAAAKPARKLKSGDRVTLRLPPPRPATPQPEDLPFDVLYEDENLVALNKPAGLVVHPAAGVHSGTLVNALLFRIKDLQGIGGEIRPGLVHRLDRDTSGCMVVAKSEAALNGLQAAFKRRDVEKRYIAIVHGTPEAKGTFDTAYGRHPRDRKRFSSKVREGKRAITHFQVLERFKPGASLMDIKLETGRTHQIRVHFSDAGHPLLHDKMYGGTKLESKLDEGDVLIEASAAMGRQALHARVLEFPHPLESKRVRVEAPIPDDFEAALSVLRKAK